MEQKIQQFLDDLRFVSSDRFDLVMAIRELFQNASSELQECIKYGGLTYSIDKQLISGIFSYKQHVSIEFSRGADFPDPEQLLEGGGKNRRHIKIREIRDLENKSVAFYIREAIKRI